MKDIVPVSQGVEMSDTSVVADLKKRVAELEQALAQGRKEQAALRKSQQWFQEVLAHSRDILFRRNLATGRYDYISRSVEELLGYTTQETLQMGYEGIEALFHPDDRQRYQRFAEQLKASLHDDEVPHTIEYRMRAKDGSYRWFSDNHGIVRDRAGRARYFIGNNRDITAEKAAEKALSESHERFLTVLDSMEALVLVSDLTHYTILMANQRAVAIFGPDVVGRKCHEAIRGKSQPCKTCHNQRLLDDTGQPTGICEWESRNPLNGKWYLHQDQAIKWEKGRYVRLQIATDISKIKALEEERMRAEAHLRLVQRLESVGTLAGGIAHDFNNLMMGMLGNLALVMMDIEPAHPYYGKLKKIETQILSGSRLTKQLLGYARKGKYRVEALDFNEIISDSAETFGRTRKQITLRLKLAPEVLGVEADQGQLEQVLLNLFINAADAMPEGGELSIKTTRVHHDQMNSGPYIPKPGYYILFEISDTGVGMEKAVQERIFEPFFTTKEMGRGTGLGLASVYGIVKSHGGYIDVDSTPGAGTTFRIYLPMAVSARPVPTAKPRTVIQSPGGTILLVDDEELVLEVATQMLERCGYQVLAARCGAESIDIFKRQSHQIDLVILDMIMPGMSGGVVFDQLRALDPSIKVLLSSGYNMQGEAEKILRRGCNGFIQKPFKLDELLNKLTKIIQA